MIAGDANHSSLRPYQRSAVEIVIRELFTGRVRAGYLELPTGGGKTRVAVEIAAIVAGRMRILFLAPTLEIAEQATQAFGAFDVGRCYGGLTQIDCAVTVAIPASLRDTRLAQYARRGFPVLVIADEAHHVTPGSLYAKAVRAALMADPRARALGLTATPFRHDGQSLEDVLGSCLFSRSIEDLQAERVLAPFEGHVLQVPELRLSSIGTSKGDFEPQALASALLTVADAVARDAGPMLRGRVSLAFAASIAHAEALTSAFQRDGFRAGFVSGAQRKDERADVLERWRRLELELVVNVGCLLEGFDYPAIDALLIARPTQSPGLYLQMLGRGLRTAPGKTACLVIDVAGNDADVGQRQLLLRDLVRERQGKRSIVRSTGGTRSNRLYRERERDLAYAWLERAGDEGLLVGNGIAVIARVDAAAGLYSAAYATRLGSEFEYIAAPTSRAQAIANVLEYVRERLGQCMIWRRDAGWHTGRPSARQRELMKGMRLRGWDDLSLTKGAASEAIAARVIDRAGSRLRETYNREQYLRKRSVG